MSPKLFPFLAFLLFLAALPVTAQVEKSSYKLGLVFGEANKPEESEQERRFREEILDAVTDAFVATRRFTMIERGQLDAVFTEKSLQDFIGGTVDDKLADVLGLDIVGIVDYTVSTSKSPQGTSATKYILDVRLVDVETASILATVTSDRPDLALLLPSSTPREAGQLLYASLRDAFPPLGSIIRVKGKDVTVDLGSDMGLKDGDTLEIVQEGERIIHPVTGKVLSAPMRVIGELKVVKASDRVSTCKLTSKREPPVASLVRPKRPASRILKWTAGIASLKRRVEERGMSLLAEPIKITIEVRSLVKTSAYFDPAESQELNLAWTAPPGNQSDVRLRAFSFKPRINLCADARVPAARSAFRWSVHAGAPGELGREDLGLIAWIELPGPANASRAVHLPLRVGSGRTETAEVGYEVSLVPSERLNEVRVTFSRLDAKGNVVTVLRRNEELGHGYYPSGKPTVFSTGRLGPAGFYRLTITAIPRSGLSVVQDLDLYHPGD